MERDQKIDVNVFRWFILCAAVCFFALMPMHVRAESSLSVGYSPAQRGYYLYRAPGEKMMRPGLYQIKGKKAHGRIFDGIYLVSGEGRINTAPGIYFIRDTKVIGKQRYYRGYYHIGKGGRLPTQRGVVYREDTKVRGHSFNGYYYHTKIGRIISGSKGLVYLDCKANGRRFLGYYHRDAMSKICVKSTIRKITRKDGDNRRFPGYRFFGRGGRLDTSQCTHRLDLTYEGARYRGYYCFAGKDGRMIRKKGLYNVEDTYYHVTDAKGRCLAGVKKKIKGFTYSFAKNGAGRRTSTKLGGLKAKLQSMTGSYGGIWSVYVKRLDDNDSLTIDDRPLYAASLIKAYVMASLYDQIGQGNVRETAEISALLRSMITVSSNVDFNELVMRQTSHHDFLTGCGVINSYLARNGFRNTGIHTAYAGLGISDGGTNHTSVRDCGRLLESIYRGTCVDSAYSKKMLGLLLGQQWRWKIPAGVPSGVAVANKTGEIEGYCEHDMAIVYGPKCTYILCVMSEGSYNAIGRIAQISRTVYDHLER